VHCEKCSTRYLDLLPEAQFPSHSLSNARKIPNIRKSYPFK